MKWVTSLNRPKRRKKADAGVLPPVVSNWFQSMLVTWNQKLPGPYRGQFSRSMERGREILLDFDWTEEELATQPELPNPYPHGRPPNLEGIDR
jgi:hypothetical protein